MWRSIEVDEETGIKILREDVFVVELVYIVMFDHVCYYCSGRTV